MKEDYDKVSLIQIKSETSSCDVTESVPTSGLNTANISRSKNVKIVPQPVQTVESRETAKITTPENDDAAEERQRTGRYLAIGVTLIMLFIAFYHTLLRHATVLAGLLAPAIIMLLYILWLFYFAKKNKTQVSTV